MTSSTVFANAWNQQRGWRAAARLCSRSALGLLLLSGSVVAADISGTVLDLRNGSPIAGAAVILSATEDGVGPDAVSVFTDEKGRYSIAEALQPRVASGTLRVSKLGIDQISPSEGEVTVSLGGDKDIKQNFGVRPASNIADQVPASAWLKDIPDNSDKHLTQLHCTPCHQFPTPKVKDWVSKIEAVPSLGQQTEDHAASWKTQIRKEAWRAAVKYMRSMTYDIFPEGSKFDMAEIPWETMQAPEYSLFTEADEEHIAEFLSKNMPTTFEYMAPDAYDHGAPLIVNAKTVIREYQLPDVSLVREGTSVPGSPYIWGADVEKNRILKLDPSTGDYVWYDVPYDGATGPHTILGDEDGNVWVSLVESDQLAIFNPETEKWRMFRLRPTNADEEGWIGGENLVHDISFGVDYVIKKDDNGRAWLTLLGSNKLAALNTDTGEMRHFPVNPVGDRSPMSIALYSVLISNDNKCAWYTQLTGAIGCMNTDTFEIETLIEPDLGAGPRRLSIDDKGNLWVPYYGAGQILKYDTVNRKTIKVYDLPDRSATPYAVTWDSKRGVLWVANSNTDVIYRFDPETEEFGVLPFTRPMAYLRKLTVDLESGDLVTSYANIPAGSGPSMAVVITPGDL